MKPAASRAQLPVPPEPCGRYGARAGWSTGLPRPHQPSPHSGPWKMGPAPRRDVTTRRGGRGKVVTLAPLFSPKPLLLGHPADRPVCRSQGAPTAGPCQEQGQRCSRGWMGSCGDTGQRTAQGHPAERRAWRPCRVNPFRGEQRGQERWASGNGRGSHSAGSGQQLHPAGDGEDRQRDTRAHRVLSPFGDPSPALSPMPCHLCQPAPAQATGWGPGGQGARGALRTAPQHVRIGAQLLIYVGQAPGQHQAGPASSA